MLATITRTKRGFTLIELLVVVAIVAITLGIGVPSFREIRSNNRMRTAVNSLTADMNLVRSEAIKRGRSVTICRSNAASSSCNTDTPSTPNLWDNGWLIFIDVNNNADFDDNGADPLCEDTEDCMIRKRPPLKQISLKFSKNRVKFDSRGTSVGYAGTFTFFDGRGASSETDKVLSSSGRLRN